MLCRVEMPTHEGIYGRFYRYQILHGPDASARMNLLVLPVLAMALCIVAWFFGFRGVLFYVLFALLAAYVGYSLWMRPVRVFRKKEGVALQTEVYIFTENGLTRSVRGEEGGVADNTSMRYDALVSAAETGKDFYLYTSPSQAYLVDKEYFTNGSPEELRRMLQEKLGAKFSGGK